MDESAFRRARGAVNARPCAFGNALLAGCCACSLAERQNIAEREAVACGSPEARAQCLALRDLLRQKSAFALKLTQVDGRLTHAEEMKVECGGLQGAQQALTPEALNPAVPASAAAPGSAERGLHSVADVHGLVLRCVERYGSLANLPYSAIVQSVAAHRTRRRRPEP